MDIVHIDKINYYLRLLGQPELQKYATPSEVSYLMVMYGTVYDLVSSTPLHECAYLDMVIGLLRTRPKCTIDGALAKMLNKLVTDFGCVDIDPITPSTGNTIYGIVTAGGCYE